MRGMPHLRHAHTRTRDVSVRRKGLKISHFTKSSPHGCYFGAVSPQSLSFRIVRRSRSSLSHGPACPIRRRSCGRTSTGQPVRILSMHLESMHLERAFHACVSHMGARAHSRRAMRTPARHRLVATASHKCACTAPQMDGVATVAYASACRPVRMPPCTRALHAGTPRPLPLLRHPALRHPL